MATARSRPEETDATFRTIIRAFGLLRRAMEPVFRERGISASQWGVLRALHRAEAEGAAVAGIVVYEAWCSQRPGGIIVMIEEVHGKPVKAGESFSAAHIVGFFDTIEEMHEVYRRHKGHTALKADPSGWRLTKSLRDADGNK